ncbi:MAG: DUF411 domain-containing protein [Gammaproteobacteria bacterium]|nr:DUF411 domain-containing protein [Gammaproteobacteria bacterium]MCK5092690.1 DUF411 domain-containing protein [Gammaproteobacteria bacterium]
MRDLFIKSIFLLSVAVSTFFQGNVYAAESVWDKATVDHAGTKDITVYHSPTCSCCKKWISHLKKHEFNVIDIETNDVMPIKIKHKLPQNMASCHTAIIDGYVIEGHVPADDIKRLIKDKPNIAGLSVPQMPAGTPGMEMGNKKDPFSVFKFDKSGKFDVYKEYWSY